MTGTGRARAPTDLGAMPHDGAMVTLDEGRVRAAPATVFALVCDVARWPAHLAHYRYVRVRESDGAGGGIVEMAANRPFGPVGWPTWWLSEMQVLPAVHAVRFRHIGGITTGMDVEWRIDGDSGSSYVTLTHVWNGPGWPLVGRLAARAVIGPVFVHGIATRTLAGLARVAEAVAARRPNAPDAPEATP